MATPLNMAPLGACGAATAAPQPQVSFKKAAEPAHSIMPYGTSVTWGCGVALSALPIQLHAPIWAWERGCAPLACEGAHVHLVGVREGRMHMRKRAHARPPSLYCHASRGDAGSLSVRFPYGWTCVPGRESAAATPPHARGRVCMLWARGEAACTRTSAHTHDPLPWRIFAP